MATSVGLRQFSANLRRLAARVETNAHKTSRRAAEAAVRSVAFSTPVDTGKARSNWNTTVGSPDFSVKEPPAEGLSGDAAAARVLGEARRVIRSWDPGTGEPLTLANGVPYIEKLDNGSSKQAPAGMTPLAMQAARAAARAGRLLT